MTQPAPNATPLILDLKNVTCAYEAGRPAIEDVSFAVQKGEILCLLGPSGCGKTTTLRVIAGFESVSGGEIILNGNAVATVDRHVPPEQRHVGMVFQEYALFPHLTVEKNVGFGLTHVSANDRQRQIDEMLAITGLSDLAERYPHSLSGGQQQRVALARALAPQPVLLLLDEPFSNLGPDMTYQMRRELRQLLKKLRTSAILVTHDRVEAFAMADTVAVLNHGKLEQFASPETLYHHPASPFVAKFVGQADFIPGTIRDATVVTELGEWPLPQSHQGRRDVLVMIRPDDVRIEKSETGCGSIESREFRGSDVLYGIRLDTGELVHGSEPSPRSFPINTRVKVNVTATHVVVFDGPAHDS